MAAGRGESRRAKAQGAAGRIIPFQAPKRHVLDLSFCCTKVRAPTPHLCAVPQPHQPTGPCLYPHSPRRLFPLSDHVQAPLQCPCWLVPAAPPGGSRVPPGMSLALQNRDAGKGMHRTQHTPHLNEQRRYNA